MRNYLALGAWMAAAELSPELRHDARLQVWIETVQEFRSQLREPSPGKYLALKRAAVRGGK
jgi:hypothetical protein